MNSTTSFQIYTFPMIRFFFNRAILRVYFHIFVEWYFIKKRAICCPISRYISGVRGAGLSAVISSPSHVLPVKLV